MTDFGNEKRRLSRSNADFQVSVAFEDGRLIQTVLVNVGIKGILVEADTVEGVRKGDRCEVHIVLAETRDIEARGTVARIAGDGFAIEFDAVDADSLIDLHNIVVYNAADPDQAMEELESAGDVGIDIYYEGAGPQPGA